LGAGKLTGKEQLAYMAFADSLEAIPRTLAENAGLEPVEIMAQLRHAHENGGRTVGVNLSGGVADMLKTGVIEPAKVKLHALKSSFEAASMILRIDDVVAASKKKEEKKGKEGEGETPEF